MRTCNKENRVKVKIFLTEFDGENGPKCLTNQEYLLKSLTVWIGVDRGI